MSEITITAGYNSFVFDPMQLMLIDAARPSVEVQDPDVVKRCPDVLKEVLSLAYRFASPEELEAKAHPDEENPQEHFVGLATPDIGYRTSHGHEATMRFLADCVLPDFKVPEFNLAQSRAYLQGKPVPSADHGRPFLHLISLYPTRIVRHGVSGSSAGGHEDLNYLQSLATRIRDKAFPRANSSAKS